MMPVRRFRDVAEMDCELWHAPGDRALWREIAGVWDFAARTSKLRFPPGVHKHRSIEEGDRQRRDWEKASLRAGKP
jgi:hypothetical protein